MFRRTSSRSGSSSGRTIKHTTSERDDSKPKFYTLVMFPYPSGDLHMGHMRNYTIGDLIGALSHDARLQRHEPDGLGRLRAARRERSDQGGHAPAVRTLENIERMKDQFFKMGIVYDWDREVASCLPEYYRWTQWMFLQMYRRGLAYRKKAAANWCPNDQTVLANEQVVNGRCERCGAEVIKKDLTQWFFRITDYADRLLDDLDMLPGWPERVKTMQRNWIGRSYGAEIDFPVVGHGGEITRLHHAARYGLRGDVHGAGPRAPAGRTQMTTEQRAAVESIRSTGRRQTEIERLSTDKEKTGVLDRRVRHQPGQRPGDTGLDSRLCAGDLRHRRDHGRARRRRARLRFRAEVRPADRNGGRAGRRRWLLLRVATRAWRQCSSPARRCRCIRARASWSIGPAGRDADRGEQGGDDQDAGGAGHGQRRLSTTACVTG